MAVCVLGAVTSVALAQDEDPMPSESYTQVTTIEEEAQDAMEVLEEARTTTDALPTDIASKVDAEADFGMNPGLSRRPIGNTTSSVFVIPGDDHVCAALTVGDGATVTCPQTDDVADGQAQPATVGLEGGGVAIYGIVPDGVESVTIETEVSDSDVVDVEDNAYYVVFPEGTVLRTVSYTGPSGAVEYPIYDPGLVFEEE